MAARARARLANIRNADRTVKSARASTSELSMWSSLVRLGHIPHITGFPRGVENSHKWALCGRLTEFDAGPVVHTATGTT